MVEEEGSSSFLLVSEEKEKGLEQPEQVFIFQKETQTKIHVCHDKVWMWGVT